MILDLYRACRSIKEKEWQNENISSIWTCTELVEVSRKKNGKMKILAQFGIFIRIIILNIGGKKANTQLFF
ncbi:MAG: hypothetical protein EBR41_00370 [Crocinitomicaceae bacterium]|nr:hypothetical protein [Crocinitomicaceae bacterium]